MLPKTDIAAAANSRQFEDLVRGAKRVYARVQHFFVRQRVHINFAVRSSRWDLRPSGHLELIYVHHSNPKFFLWFLLWRLTTLRRAG